MSAFFGGMVNAIAGGGSFLTFPALLFAGIPGITANATSATALVPGALASAYAYRKDFEPVEGISVRFITALSMAGGIIGAALLLMTPEADFDQLIPWLLLSATIVFAFGRPFAVWARARFRIDRKVVLIMQFIIAIYGGYFGGGIGILMLAAFGIFGMTNLNSMNALKTLLAACLNLVAVALFIAKGQVLWREALEMAVTAGIGGYAGAAIARKVDPAILRAVIVAIGLAMSAWFFAKAHSLI